MRARDEAVSAVSLALKNADNSSSTAMAARMRPSSVVISGVMWGSVKSMAKSLQPNDGLQGTARQQQVIARL